MAMNTLEYHARTDQRWRFRLSRRAMLAVAAVVSFLLVPTASVRQTRSRIDAVTGSMEWQTTWFGLFSTMPRIDASPLEKRLLRMGATWTRDWRLLHNTHRTLLGNATCYECGTAPPIHGLRPVLDEFVQTHSDEQIISLINIIQTGAEDEQDAAVELAADTAL